MQNQSFEIILGDPPGKRPVNALARKENCSSGNSPEKSAKKSQGQKEKMGYKFLKFDGENIFLQKIESCKNDQTKRKLFDKIQVQSEPADMRLLDYDRFLELACPAENMLLGRKTTKDAKKEIDGLKRAPQILKGLTQNRRHFAAMRKKKSNQNVKKTNSSLTLKKKSSKMMSDLYNINNFIVQSTSAKIIQRSGPRLNIQVPRFCEIPELEAGEYSSEEETSDEVYIKYHQQYEQREREYREKYFGEIKKKAHKKQNKADAVTHTESSEGNNLKFKIEMDKSQQGDAGDKFMLLL